MRKFLVLLTLVMMMVISSCGCNSEPAADQVYVVNLCYVNSEYMTTGNDELPALVYYENHHIYCPKGEQYFTLLDVTLRSDPFGIAGIDTMITEKIKFKSVKVKGETAFVDMESDGLSGSSLEEGLLISQIVNSLIGSFDEVKQVQFMIDGKIPETIMGHYDAEEPYTEGIYSNDNDNDTVY